MQWGDRIFPWWYRLLGVDLIIASKMNEIASLKNLLDYNQHLVEEKDQEIARLTNLMLTRAGFIVPDQKLQSTEGRLEPINRKPSWPQRQRELEKEDARKLSDEIERRWKEKPGAMSNGIEGNESVSDRDFVQGK